MANEHQLTKSISETLLAKHQKKGNTPKGALEVWLEAIIRVQLGEEEALKAIGKLTLDLRNNEKWHLQSGQSFFLKPIRENKPCFRSLVIGATPDNAYQVDINNIQVKVTKDTGPSKMGHKLFLHSSGADSPRPVILKRSKKTGLYYIYNYHSLYVGVRPPTLSIDEEFE